MRFRFFIVLCCAVTLLYSGTVTASASTLATGTQVRTSSIATHSPAKRATTKKSTGTLRVTIEGVPSGATAVVRISGPRKFTRTLSSTTVLKKLRPGTYTLSAAEITVGQSSTRAAVTQKKAKVKAGATRRIAVTYAPLPLVSPLPTPTPTPTPGPTVSEAATSLSAVAGDEQATLSWIAPTNTGGQPILDYVLHYTKDGSTWFPANDPISPSTSSIVTGLANGDNYQFRVVPVTAVGQGAYSAASNTVTPLGVPNAPLQPTAISSASQSATISWSTPDSGGTPITSYGVTAAPGGQVCVTSTNSCSIGGLTNGTAYTFTATATNAVGTSPTSTPTSPVTPATIPDAPTATTATRGNTAATVSWLAPSNGGAPVTSYTVISSPGGRTCTTSTTQCAVGGLTNGTAYVFTVSATNRIGTSESSAASAPITPATTPSAPTDASGTRGNQSVAVSWAAPQDGGAPVASYKVTSSPGAKTCTTSLTTCTVSGLINGTPYTFTVTAVNVVGTSGPSAPTAAVTPATVPNAPINPVAIRSDQAATVIWSAPDNGGAAITSYTVTSSPGGKTCTTSAASCTIADLSNGTSYTFSVTATNNVGTSLASLPTGSVTPKNCSPAPARDLAGCDLSGQNLARMDITNSDLSGANLTGADLTDADLSGSKMPGVVVQGAVFTDAEFARVNTGGWVGTPVLDSLYRIENGFLVGPGVKLDGEDLAGLNLSGVNFRGATLVGTNLTGADLFGVSIESTDMTGAILAGVRSGEVNEGWLPSKLPAGWKVYRYFIGPGADLRGAQLQHSTLNNFNFSGADLTGADLSGSQLSANFSYANCTNANLSSSSMSGISVVGGIFTGANLTNIVGSDNVGPPAALPTGWRWAGDRFSQIVP